MKPGENIALCITLVMGWGVLTAQCGLPWWVAAIGGTLIGAIFFWPTVAAVSRHNRGE